MHIDRLLFGEEGRLPGPVDSVVAGLVAGLIDRSVDCLVVVFDISFAAVCIPPSSFVFVFC